MAFLIKGGVLLGFNLIIYGSGVFGLFWGFVEDLGGVVDFYVLSM